MVFKFTNSDISSIENILGNVASYIDNSWTWKLKSSETNQTLVFTIYNSAKISSENEGVLISIQTQFGYFELHDCNAYLIFEPDEIIFINSQKDKLSSLVIGKSATCSLFSNIDRGILNTDFSELDPSVLLAAMQLSITETILA